MKIAIETIPHAEQRYATAGDWVWSGRDLIVRVSAMSDERYAFLVGIHELVEAMLCRHEGIPQAEVDAYDQGYEAMRLPGDESEPGDSLEAPYARQHAVASGIERLLAGLLDVDWLEYEGEINALGS